ncbi:MAG: diphthine--ammonia ligase [Bacteroidia bacterium]|nr:diphthine--ammonia ligase [Bacteroidia bacterium]MDW8303035.1 diphthine--ammonia ligase [Bacteroidia bacterium]
MYKTFFNWSSGKDSALALYYLLQDKRYSVEYLLTSINTDYNRVSMHGIRVELLRKQLNCIDIPYGFISLSQNATNAEYEARMRQRIMELKFNGFEYAAFGDIFLEDIRKYRESQLNPLNIKAIFPLWQKNTTYLIEQFIELGFKAIVVCINTSVMDTSFLGRIIDKSFIKDLPANVDPCGENGEFHTFCFDGPIFKRPVSFSIGEFVFREYKNSVSSTGFWFCDLLY